jgi:geranylgeranyl diphosphate synthase type II
MKTVDELSTLVNEYIAQLTYPEQPQDLYAPIKYTLAMGGKRMRPVLMLLAYQLYKKDVQKILSQATAIETYHNYTLLHDDVMDEADVRRGFPTVHKKWNENVAILSGDAMLIVAYRYLLQSLPIDTVVEVQSLFTTTALEICEGQQYDMDFEIREDVTECEYLEMIRLKTAVLLATSLKIGAILGGASAIDADLIYQFGVNIGLAFQLKDDLLDVYGDELTFGKKIGGDICNNKKTFLLIKALELAEGKDEKTLLEWLNKKDFDVDEKIKSVTSIYNRLKIKEICETKMNGFYATSMNSLSVMKVDEEAKKILIEYAAQLMDRIK